MPKMFRVLSGPDCGTHIELERALGGFDDIAGGEQPSPSGHDGGCEWQPVKHKLSLFMTAQITCTACLLARAASGLGSTQQLHVLQNGPDLFITEIDDLHLPGRCLLAISGCERDGSRVFRLTAECPDEFPVTRFRPASGAAELAWRGGRWHLHVTCVTGGCTGDSAHFIDASESD